jgi:hypothetical protein
MINKNRKSGLMGRALIFKVIAINSSSILYTYFSVTMRILTLMVHEGLLKLKKLIKNLNQLQNSHYQFHYFFFFKQLLKNRHRLNFN